MSSTAKIAFLGTGLMGSHMARNILKAGFSLTAWNRTLAKAQALIADGADVPATAAEAIAIRDLFASCCHLQLSHVGVAKSGNQHFYQQQRDSDAAKQLELLAIPFPLLRLNLTASQL